MTTLSHSLDHSSTDPCVLACILNDFSSTRNVAWLVKGLVLTGDQTALDNIVHDNDSPFPASLDCSIKVVPIVYFVCIHICHVELEQFSSIDVGEYGGKCFHSKALANSDSVAETSIGDVLSRNLNMMRVIFQSRDLEIGVLGCEPNTGISAQSTNFEAVLCVDGFGLQGEELCKGARGVDGGQILVRGVGESTFEDGTVVCG